MFNRTYKRQLHQLYSQLVIATTLPAELKECKTLGAIKKIHAKALQTGGSSTTYTANSLIQTYSRCGSLVDAKRVFETTVSRSSITWNSLILGYARCRRLSQARMMFQRMPCHTAVSWTVMIQSHAEHEQEELSLAYATALLNVHDFLPDARTFLAIFNACSRLAAKKNAVKLKLEPLEMSFRAHAQLEACGVESDIFLENSLVHVYSKCGSMIDSRRVFDRMKDHDIVSWNSLLLGYAENGDDTIALELFQSMNLPPNSRSFVAAIKACTILASKEKVDEYSDRTRLVVLGRSLHERAAESRFESDIYVASSLVSMYAKLGNLQAAKRVFDRITYPDVVCYNSMILGYVENGDGELALHVFKSMHVQPDALVFVSALKACVLLAEKEQGQVKLASLERGMAIHSGARDLDIFAACTLVDMYSKCGSLLDARTVFDRTPDHNVVLWNALMLGCVDNGEANLALELFHSMSCKPDSGSFMAALKACTHLATDEEGVRATDGKLVKRNSLKSGTMIHSQAKASGGDLTDSIVVASALVGMYAKCGSLSSARLVFDQMTRHDTVSWTALMTGYVENGETKGALELYARMKQECRGDARTFVAALKACAAGSLLESGRALHGDITRCGLECDLSVAVTLVDFYGKCSRMNDARYMFESHHGAARETVAWNALLESYSREGEVGEVFQLFHRMVDEGVHVSEATFVSVLTACSHAALVRKGKQYLSSMTSRFGVTPRVEHYACMADILSRAGLLEEALTLVRCMPCEPNSVVWTIILAAACKWNNLQVGKLAFQSLLQMDSRAAAPFTLMANICSSVPRQASLEKTTLPSELQ